MTETENNENKPKRPDSLADLLTSSKPDVEVRYVPHLQDAQNDGLGETEGTTGVDQQHWLPGEDVHARPTLTGGNPQSSKTMRPGPSDPAANPESETSQG